MHKPKKIMRRYHNRIYFPENTAQMCLEFFGQIQDVDVTYHAAEQLMEDARGIIPLPSKIDLLHPTNTLVEFYENCDSRGNPNGVMQKVLIRVHHFDEKRDFSYVLAREGFIVSAWANDKTDQHRLTERAGEYYRPAHARAA